MYVLHGAVCNSGFHALGIHHPWTKYKTTFKNEEKDIAYNFWIMKIRYMKDKVKRHLNLK